MKNRRRFLDIIGSRQSRRILLLLLLLLLSRQVLQVLDSHRLYRQSLVQQLLQLLLLKLLVMVLRCGAIRARIVEIDVVLMRVRVHIRHRVHRVHVSDGRRFAHLIRLEARKVLEADGVIEKQGSV